MWNIYRLHDKFLNFFFIFRSMTARVPRISTFFDNSGPWPDPTWAYFWPAVNKRPTCPLTQVLFDTTRWDFFDPKGRKLKNLGFLGEIIQTQTKAMLTWLNPSKEKLTRQGPKNFDPDPSLQNTQLSAVTLWLLLKTEVIVSWDDEL